MIEPEFGMDRDEFMRRLGEQGIPTRAFFIPMHLQPAFLNMGLFGGERYPVSEEISGKGLYLPSGSGLDEETIKYVCETIKSFNN